MMKKLLFLMAVVAIFGGCKRNEGSLTPDERDEEKWVWRFDSLPTDTSVMILDSMLNKLYVDASPASRARHEWEWAREARRALGLSSEVIIPMCGGIESLNAATAASVAMYEILRQRGK